jgi:hypothetical protein
MQLAARSTVFVLFLFVSGCSDNASSAPGTAIGSGGGFSGSAGSGLGGRETIGGGAGASAGTNQGTGGVGGVGGGGESSGGSGGAVQAGAGGAPMIDAATVDGSDGSVDSGGGGGPVIGDAGDGPRSFKCTLVIGCYQTSQWFDGGFENAVGSAKWEIKWDHNTFTEHWADPADAFWNLQVASSCTSGATSPDRVLFISYSTTLATEAAWETQLTRVVDNVKTKFPSVERIELLGMVRAPNNQMCAGNNNVSTVVRPEEDQAMQAVADKSGGLVQIGPKYFAPRCDSFIPNNTNLSAAGASAVATALSAIYK